MTDVHRRLAELSPERRRLLELRMKTAQARAAGPEVRPRARPGGTAPLSFAQQRLWVIDRMQPGGAFYTMPVPLDIRGPLDAAALERALGALVARHESLRTTFAERGGVPVQVIHPPAPFSLPADDLSRLAPEERAAEARRRIDADANTGFDLEAGPLFRARLLRLAADEHVLLLCMHHIVSDGWSMGVLQRELGALYAASHAGRPDPLPPPALQYADFAVWQREHLRGETLERHLDFWRLALEGAPPALELPTDRPRPAVESHRGAIVRRTVPAELANALRELARETGGTLFAVLLAGLRVVLARHAGEDDVVIGTPVANRTRSETEGLVGFFVNTLALRGRVPAGATFRELARREAEAALRAFNHQDLPFDRLVEELRLPRDPGRNPLFQVMMTLQNARMEPPELPGCAVRPLRPEYDTAKFDLAFDFYEEEGGALRLDVQYASDLFDPETAERMAGHFAALLEAALAEPDRPLSRLPGLLRGEERRRVLAEWGRPEHPFPSSPVHELFEAQADADPRRAAVSFGAAEITYRELDERANRLAHHLIARGVGPETRVGLFAERSPEAVVAILAVLKAGGAWLPLDPAHPPARLAWMASDAGARVLAATADVPAGLAAAVGDVVDLRKEADAIARRPAGRPRAAVGPDHLAYVVYTSGSTGLPKGVLVTHRGVPNLALAQARAFQVGRGSRVLQFASLSFDASVSEVFATLLAGATLVVAPRPALVPGPALLETLRREKVTHVTLPPSVLAVLPPDGLPELRTLVSAGEAVSAGVVERWAPGRRFVNAYGPTEATVGTTGAVCEPDGRVPAIGRPFDNVRVYVLDAGGEPVPVGVPGELFVGGPGVARGYHGRAALTAGRFVPDAFSGEPGARLYRTGDRVRWRDGGELEFLGRTDEQVKLRGFRVEPGEVAAVLASLPGVCDALALVREHAGDRRLVAWAVAGPGGERPSPPELRAELKRRLPGYMVPSAVVVLDDFPRTPHGKVDRAALPLPEAEAGEAFAAPQGELEQRIAGVWREVLGRGAVGVNDNFFEIGGHSLLLARLHECLRAALGVEVGLMDLFQFPTIAALAAHLEQRAKAGQGETAPEPRQAGRDRGSARRQALTRKR